MCPFLPLHPSRPTQSSQLSDGMRTAENAMSAASTQQPIPPIFASLVAAADGGTA